MIISTASLEVASDCTVSCKIHKMPSGRSMRRIAARSMLVATTGSTMHTTSYDEPGIVPKQHPSAIKCTVINWRNISLHCHLPCLKLSINFNQDAVLLWLLWLQRWLEEKSLEWTLSYEQLEAACLRTQWTVNLHSPVGIRRVHHRRRHTVLVGISHEIV